MMRAKKLGTDRRGVSPVIGVILMVAVTVIVSAVIGATALGIGQSAQETPPQTALEIEQFQRNSSSGGQGPAKTTAVRITLTGGDSIDTDNIEITVDGEPAFGGTNDANHDYVKKLWNSGETIRAGDSVTVVAGTTFFEADNGHPWDPNNRYEWFYDGPNNNRDKAPLLRDNTHKHSHLRGWGDTASWQLTAGDVIRVTWRSDDSSSSLGTHEVTQPN